MTLMAIDARCLIVTFPLKAMKPITLSDGTYIPKDSFVMSSVTVHFDEEFFENPYTFDGFRFVTPAAEGAAPSAGNGLSKATTGFLSFGQGRHTWWVQPFYAAARQLLTYTLPPDSVRIFFLNDPP